MGLLCAGLPADFPAPILVAMHLDPDHVSQVVPLLQRHTPLRVAVAETGLRAKAGTVYVAPPDHHLQIRGGTLRLSKTARVNFSRPNIDVLFASVAAEYGPGAVVGILSGTGHDGTAGMVEVTERGGVAFAEDPSTATFSGMPGAAARTGFLDAILPIDQVPAFLSRVLRRRIPVSEHQWTKLLAVLEEQTGTKFAQYRSSTLHRRLQQRMAVQGCASMTAYLRILDKDPSEVERLHESFLIKVSSFFRDPGSWRSLAKRIASYHPPPGMPVRAWSAGCATGEEAYSLAILLAHRFGVGADWKVFATDLDADALQVARTGRYRNADLEAVPAADRARYFQQEGLSWRVGRELRGHVVFGRHNLLRDPPLRGMDVLACRNVLVYVNRAEKRRALLRLTASVRPGGYLFLGNAEAPMPVPGMKRVGRTNYFQRAVDVPTMPDEGERAGDPINGDGHDGKRPRKAARRPRDPTSPRTQEDLNDELQSRNEELETVNEELQSLNDEMTAMEDEMRDLIDKSQRTNDFLRTLLDTSPEAVVACDAKNRVVFWNKAAVKRFFLSPEQALGGDLLKLVPALGKKDFRAAAKKVREPRGTRATVKEDGAEYRFQALPAEKGKGRGYVLRVR